MILKTEDCFCYISFVFADSQMAANIVIIWHKSDFIDTVKGHIVSDPYIYEKYISFITRT
jgi:hypothetical protein